MDNVKMTPEELWEYRKLIRIMQLPEYPPFEPLNTPAKRVLRHYHQLHLVEYWAHIEGKWLRKPPLCSLLKAGVYRVNPGVIVADPTATQAQDNSVTVTSVASLMDKGTTMNNQQLNANRDLIATLKNSQAFFSALTDTGRDIIRHYQKQGMVYAMTKDGGWLRKRTDTRLDDKGRYQLSWDIEVPRGRMVTRTIEEWVDFD